MEQRTPEITWESVQEVLEKQFPKGECKERGSAIVLYAYAKMAFDYERSLLAKKDKRIEELKDEVDSLLQGHAGDKGTVQMQGVKLIQAESLLHELAKALAFISDAKYPNETFHEATKEQMMDVAEKVMQKYKVWKEEAQ